MPTALKVTPEQLQALSGTVARTSSDVRGAHQSLRGQLGPLFGADWSGTAAAQFSALFDQFDQHARGLSDALDGIGQLLGRAGISLCGGRGADSVVFPLTMPSDSVPAGDDRAKRWQQRRRMVLPEIESCPATKRSENATTPNPRPHMASMKGGRTSTPTSQFSVRRRGRG